ncbi:MAG: hypothetical protein WCP73_07775 [Eubacteriales bacterium]
MKFKKVLLVVLAIALLAAMLSACTPVAQPSAPVSAAPSVSATPEPTPTATAAPSASAAPSVSASAAPVKDADPYGTVNGQVYTNNAAQFEITLPEGYQTINSAESIREYGIQTFDAHRALYKNPDALKQAIQTVEIPGLIAYMHPDGKPDGLNNELSAAIEKMDSSVKADNIVIAKLYIQSMKENSDKYKISDPVAVKIGGVDSAYFTNAFTLNSISFSEKYYIFKNNGYAVILCETAMDKTAMDGMDAAVKTIKITSVIPIASVSSQDIIGTLDGNTYTNEAAGFALAYPDSYTALNRNEITKLMKAAMDKIKEIYKDPDLMERALEENIPASIALKHDLSYTDGYNSGITIMVERLSVPDDDTVEFAKISMQAAQKQTDSLKIEKIGSAKLGGHAAAVADTTLKMNGIKVYERIYFVSNNDYMFTITLAAANSTDLKELDKVANGIQFTA